MAAGGETSLTDVLGLASTTAGLLVVRNRNRGQRRCLSRPARCRKCRSLRRPASTGWDRGPRGCSLCRYREQAEATLARLQPMTSSREASVVLHASADARCRHLSPS